MIRHIIAGLERETEGFRDLIAAAMGTPLERELRNALALLYATIEELEIAQRLEEQRVPAIH